MEALGNFAAGGESRMFLSLEPRGHREVTLDQHLFFRFGLPGGGNIR